jgi:hypothetical protein
MTLKFDEDVLLKLMAEAKRTGSSLEDVVNQSLRCALPESPGIPPFEVKAHDLHARPGLNFDCTSRLLDEIEGPLHK